MKAFHVQTNDMMLVIYLAALIRSVIALHNLINNKLDYKTAEESTDSADGTYSLWPGLALPAHAHSHGGDGDEFVVVVADVSLFLLCFVRCQESDNDRLGSDDGQEESG